MRLKEQLIHPMGECREVVQSEANYATTVDSFSGKIHIEWDSDVSVTSIGQLAFFIEHRECADNVPPYSFAVQVNQHQQKNSALKHW